MPTCPTCRQRYEDGVLACPADGEALLPDEAFRNADNDLAVGAMVGEYRIEAKIGAGGFGTVYRATHPLIGKTAAIKVLSRQYSSSPQMVSRFIAEARAVNQIRHKNIVDIFSFGSLQDGRQYYTMELLVGRTLDQLIRERGRLPPELAVPIFRGIARALDAAHAAGIAHRDLKPENVFLIDDDDAGMVPKLLDFGIAKLLTEATSGPKTRTGTPMGTPEYMSPEQCRGKNVDERTDVYSFGIMAHEALTGRRPFSGDVMDLLMHQVHTAAPPVSVVHQNLAPELDAPILRMLEKDPEKRPASVGVAIQALEDAAVAAGYPVPRAAKIERSPASLEREAARRASPIADTLTPEEVVALESRKSSPSRSRERSPALTPAEPAGRSIAGATADTPALPPRRPMLFIAIAIVVAAAVAVPVILRVASPAPGPGAALPSASVPRVPEVAPPPSAAPAAPPPVEPSPTVELVIQSTPDGADVYLGPEKVGVAPGPIKLPRGAEKLKLTVKAQGYKPAEVTVVPSANGIVSVSLTKLGGKGPRLHPELEF